MATRADLAAKIADDLDRTDLTTQISQAITDAVRHYESERFAFNEAKDVTHTFSISSDVVPLTNLAVYFMKIDRFRMQYSGSSNLTDLTPRDYDWIMDGQDVKASARPLEYCIYADSINFDSKPDAAYVGVLDGIRRLSGASATASYSAASTAAWFNEGKNLIRARAKADLYANVIRDVELARVADTMEQRELAELRQKLNTRNSGRIRPTQW